MKNLAKFLYCHTHETVITRNDVADHMTETRCDVKTADTPKTYALPVLEPRRGWNLVTLPNGAYEWIVL